jgi:hypothetical protein
MTWRIESFLASANTVPGMRRGPTTHAPAFERVKTAGLALAGVEATTKYDGSPVLKAGGSFMAGLATHRSAEPDTLVVRAGFHERDGFLADAPDIYYVTDYYRKHPVVLVRLSRIDDDALRDLLSASWRLALMKARTRSVTRPRVKRPTTAKSGQWSREVV